MEDARKAFYIAENDNLQGFDVFKRNAIRNDKGILSDQKICTLYSMEYLDSILSALGYEDMKEPEDLDEEETLEVSEEAAQKIDELKSNANG